MVRPCNESVFSPINKEANNPNIDNIIKHIVSMKIDNIIKNENKNKTLSDLLICESFSRNNSTQHFLIDIPYYKLGEIKIDEKGSLLRYGNPNLIPNRRRKSPITIIKVKIIVARLLYFN